MSFDPSPSAADYAEDANQDAVKLG
jgi:hypothetical protein